MILNLPGKRVRIEDVNYLMQKLNNYAYLWSELGTALDFHPGELDNIRYSPQAITLQQRLKELLSRWSQWPTQDHRRVPTMEMLRDALRSRLVGLGAVATQVYESRHELPSWQEKVKICFFLLFKVLICLFFFHSLNLKIYH